MKDTLIEIKNNLQANNSRMDEAEIQINDLEHKEAKNQLEQQEKDPLAKMRRQRNMTQMIEQIKTPEK